MNEKITGEESSIDLLNQDMFVTSHQLKVEEVE